MGTSNLTVGTRATIIGTLFAVEVALFGAIVYFLGGAPTHAASVNIGGERIVEVLDAGSAPRVVVDDPDSRVVLTPSSDGRVHVTDRSALHGWMFGEPKAIAPVRVTRTADGVKIERASYSNTFMIFGSSTARIEIALPVQSAVEVKESSGTDATGLLGGAQIRSQDGHLTLRDLGGTIDAQTDDGHIDAIGIHSPSVLLNSKDGHIELRDVVTPALTAHTDDGRIEFLGALAENGTYDLRSGDGHISVQSPGIKALTIHALTQDGSIRIDGRRIGGEGDGKYDAAGTASGKLSVQTQSGSITITTMGVQ
ncbi:MAG: hypothetical protein NVS9B12_02100 [Vulcanimicrobiaceae bacterium]